MKSNQQTISIHFVLELLNAIQINPSEGTLLLENAGISPVLLRTPLARISPMQFSRFILSIWRKTDDEFMCMSTKNAKFGLFMLLARHAVHLSSLRDFYDYLGRFYDITGSSMSIRLETHQESSRLMISTTANRRYMGTMLIEFYLMVWHRFGSWLVGHTIELEAVEFSFPEPGHSAEYRLMYPCEVRFNCEQNALVLRNSELAKQVIQDPSSLELYLRRLPYDWFTKQAYFQTYTQKCYEYISKSGLESASLEGLAAELHITSRTLRRKLSAEETGFQTIKDRFRLDQAITLLWQQRLSVSEISLKLGYSDAPSFSRAFKHWTGVSPKLFKPDTYTAR